MTRLELIKLIGDVLTKLDVLRGSLMPDDPARRELNRLRKQLDGSQLKLVQTQFNENTKAFLQATAELEAINKDLKKTLTSVEKLVTTITNLKRFVAAVNGIVGAVAPLL